MKKKVVFEADPTFNIKEVEDNHFIGVEFKQIGKTFPVNINSNKWVLIGFSDIGKVLSIGSYMIVEPSLRELIIDASKRASEVYKFGTKQELIDWLNE